jgi:branched-chain amino acid transport system ATP-binding protein
LLLPLLLVPWLPTEVDAALATASEAAILATAWSSLARSGLVSFGLAGPFGAGAYAFALILSRDGAPVLAIVSAAAVGVVSSLVLDLGTRWRRLPVAAFAAFTLAWAEILRAGVGNLSFTGGPSGVLLPAVPGSRAAAAVGVGAAVLASLALAAASGPRLRPLLAAVAADPAGAEALGLPVCLTHEGALAATGLTAGLAGALSAWTVGFVEPQSAFSPLVSALAMGAGVGGGGPPWGPAALGLYFSSFDQLFLSPAVPTLHAVAVAALLALVLAVRRPMAWSAIPTPERAGRRQRSSPRPARAFNGSLLTIRDVRVTRGGIVALGGVDLEVGAGEVVGLVGPNGSGKTTLLDAISGLLPYEGSVVFDGRAIDRLAPHARARLGIARTFQVPRAVAGLSGRELANLGLRRKSLSLPPPLPSPAWIDGDLWGERSSADHTPSELRRMELARALGSGAGILLLDEPAAGLAPSLIPEIAGSISSAAAAGRGVILVEHAPSMVARVANRVLHIIEGRLARADGRPEERAVRPGEGRSRSLSSNFSGRDPVLRALGLSAGYGGGDVLKEVDLVVGRGEVVALVGPNGAGKSTLVLAMLGLLPSVGKVLIDGRDIAPLPPFVRASLGMSWIPERPRVFSGLSVAEHIAVAGEAGKHRSALEEARLRLPGIWDLLPRRAGALSAGQRKLVQAAAALARSPKILLADDPFLGLDDTSTDWLASALEAARSEGTAVVLSGQDRDLLGTLADRAYLLAAGRIVAEGPVDILTREEADLLRGQ